VSAIEWCFAIALGLVIVYCITPWDKYGALRITLAVLAAVALLIGVLIGTGVIPTAR